MRTSMRWLCLALALAVGAAACGRGGPLQAEAKADEPRLAADAGLTPPVVEAANRFAVDLYRELAGDDNLVFSPYSVAIALAMARAGAAGDTATQMDAVLHFAGVIDPHAGLNALDQALEGRSGTFTRSDGSDADLELRVANALWGQRDTAFEQPFLSLLARQYGAGMRLVDYVTDAEGARREINDWVAGQTSGRIEDLIPPGALSALTRLVLTNAVYLLAPWEYPFDEGATSAGPFTRLDGTETTAQLMALFERLPYAAGDGWQAVELPYAGGELAMLVVVPDPGTFADFDESFDAGTLADIVAGLSIADVDLRFPRFEHRTQASLSGPLVALGLVDGFDPDRADFSRMTAQERLFISDVIHEAFISVDEEGTEAAAATAVVMAAGSAPPEPVVLTVDRPFVYQIRDRSTGAVLFFGRVVDPAS